MGTSGVPPAAISSNRDRPYHHQMWCSMIRFRHKLALAKAHRVYELLVLNMAG